MTNWLESEEEKKALEAKKRLLEINEALIRADDLSKKEAIRSKKEVTIDVNLKTFYDLCDRVLKLNINSLNIFRLKVVGSKLISHEPKRYYNYDGVSGYIPDTTVAEKRSVRFSATDSDQILIDVLGYSVTTTHYDSERKDYEKTNSSTDRFSKKCLLQDILAWPEDKMIKIIRWLIFELDSFEENLPGEFENLIEKKKKAEIQRQQNLAKDIDNANLSESIGKGILWALIGLPIGFIVGGILAFLIWLLLALFGNDIGDKGMNNIVKVIIVISGIFGFFIGFVSTREKK